MWIKLAPETIAWVVAFLFVSYTLVFAAGVYFPRSRKNKPGRAVAWDSVLEPFHEYAVIEQVPETSSFIVVDLEKPDGDIFVSMPMMLAKRLKKDCIFKTHLDGNGKLAFTSSMPVVVRI